MSFADTGLVEISGCDGDFSPLARVVWVLGNGAEIVVAVVVAPVILTDAPGELDGLAVVVVIRVAFDDAGDVITGADVADSVGVSVSFNAVD